MIDIIPIASWLPGAEPPYIISGPCSAESAEQMLETAVGICSTSKVDVIRAGIWKPRTRPNSFEGKGKEALRWLKAAGEAVGKPVATEVANAHHVEVCLEAGIDMLWVGARTTVNPFSVQEIADALRGADVPVFVKNPVNPDLELWVGALERINQAGIKKLAAIHRGFSSFSKTHFRNSPMWEIPIELKTIFPHLPLFCDPSHIAGSRALLGSVAQKALDLAMTGLMIEAHIEPEKALSDADQQVSVDGLHELLAGLNLRSTSTTNPEFANKLEELRSIIDEIDEDLLRKIGHRMSIAEKIGEYKKENNVTILQLKRWEYILENRMALALPLDLSPEFTKELLQAIHKESIRKQTEIMNREVVPGKIAK